ncbi:MAG TPA: hypothetical protein VIN72_10895 [Lutibacter sp.]
MLNDSETSHATISSRDSSIRCATFRMTNKQNVMLNDREASHDKILAKNDTKLN